MFVEKHEPIKQYGVVMYSDFGFRGETGVDGLTCVAAALSDIFFDKGVDKVFALGDFSHIRNLSFVSLHIYGHYTLL